MTTLEREPLLDSDSLETLEHVNDHHSGDLLRCLHAFSPLKTATRAQIVALYSGGMLLLADTPQGRQEQFVPFAKPAPLHEALHATVEAALERLGQTRTPRLAQWRLLEARNHTAHIRRLIFALGQDTRSDWQPGYACRFAVPGQKHGRPYTLRRVYGDKSQVNKAEVDVYCHHDALGQDTLGSLWAQSLEVGAEVEVMGGRQETMPDFSAGPALLLGDETALPTIAALLEGWAHEWPVRVLLEVADPADQRYLDDVCLPRGCHVSWLPRQAVSGAALLAVVDTLETPPVAVWGALEVSSARQMRLHLREEYPAADIKMTGYWRVNEEN